jgi:putative FmdB family regulatory protein
MPRYRYACERCGPFDEMRPMSAYAEPCQCPGCGEMARREVAAASIAGRGSLESKSQAPSLRHRPGCGCCGPAARPGLRAEAASAAAPKNGSAPAGSFLTRA